MLKCPGTQKTTGIYFIIIKMGNLSISLSFYVFCYEQTSPLGVPLYAFGYPLRVQFVRSETFFLSLGMLKCPGTQKTTGIYYIIVMVENLQVILTGIVK